MREGCATMGLQMNLNHAYTSHLCVLNPPGFSPLPPPRNCFCLRVSKLPRHWAAPKEPFKAKFPHPDPALSQGCSVCTPAQDTLPGTGPGGCRYFPPPTLSPAIFPWLYRRDLCFVSRTNAVSWGNETSRVSASSPLAPGSL